jgi:hypothetical protein
MGKSFREQLWDYIAAALAPNNPRVVFGKEFEIEQRSFGNRYKTHVCPNKAIGLCYFKPETMFSPSWGLDRALAAKPNVNKK